jgi:hypothetical protein
MRYGVQPDGRPVKSPAMKPAEAAAKAADGLYAPIHGFMVDFFAYDTVEAFRAPGCPLCRTLAETERHDMAVFVREGRSVPEARLRLVASGGFCRRHARLFEEICNDAGAEWVVASVYRQIVGHDIGRLRSIRRLRRGALKRARRCPACEGAEDAAVRRAGFLVDALRSLSVRSDYALSDGLCADHLEVAVAVAADGEPRVARFLVDDWRGRLSRLAEHLDRYDRTRDHRFAHERTAAQVRACADVLRRYVGDAEDVSTDR